MPRRSAPFLSLMLLALAGSYTTAGDTTDTTRNPVGPLTALLLTYNWFGDSFFEASCRLGCKPTGRFL